MHRDTSASREPSRGRRRPDNEQALIAQMRGLELRPGGENADTFDFAASPLYPPHFDNMGGQRDTRAEGRAIRSGTTRAHDKLIQDYRDGLSSQELAEGRHEEHNANIDLYDFEFREANEKGHDRKYPKHPDEEVRFFRIWHAQLRNR
jgi:hypothetical protein